MAGIQQAREARNGKGLRSGALRDAPMAEHLAALVGRKGYRTLRQR